MSSNPLNDLLSLQLASKKRRNDNKILKQLSRQKKKKQIETLHYITQHQQSNNLDNNPHNNNDIDNNPENNNDFDNNPDNNNDLDNNPDLNQSSNCYDYSSENSSYNSFENSFDSSSNNSLNNSLDSCNGDDFLYNGSNITVEHFSTIFIAMVKNSGISKNKVSCVLELFRLVLPSSNKIPNSYDSMLNKKNISKLIDSHYICTNCKSELEKRFNICQSCGFTKISKCIISNVKLQLEIILENHMKSIIKYKGKISIQYFS